MHPYLPMLVFDGDKDVRWRCGIANADRPTTLYEYFMFCFHSSMCDVEGRAKLPKCELMSPPPRSDAMRAVAWLS